MHHGRRLRSRARGLTFAASCLITGPYRKLHRRARSLPLILVSELHRHRDGPARRQVRGNRQVPLELVVAGHRRVCGGVRIPPILSMASWNTSMQASRQDHLVNSRALPCRSPCRGESDTKRVVHVALLLAASLAGLSWMMAAVAGRGRWR